MDWMAETGQQVTHLPSTRRRRTDDDDEEEREEQEEVDVD